MKLNFNQAFEKALNKPENAEVKKRLESFQFLISQEILGERISLGLSPYEVAHRIGISEEEYRGYENGINISATEYEYRLILSKLENLANHEMQNISCGSESLYSVKDVETTFKVENTNYDRGERRTSKPLLMKFLTLMSPSGHRIGYTYEGLKANTQEKSDNNNEIKLSRIPVNGYSIQTEKYRIAY